MRILALEPYLGGSHRAFLDGWSAVSRHDWTIIGLPPHKWKWRMRHAAVTLADDVRELAVKGFRWDLLFCSDMLNLAEFRGLAAESVAALPAVVYFHENQLTYPVRQESERDLHFALTNLTTALAARQVWFNSAFHRDSFLEALVGFLGRMPDYQMPDKIASVRSKAHVRPQGISPMPPRGARPNGPPHILWVARWEHDKNPELFFAALRQLVDQGVEFRVSVLGQSFGDRPEVFSTAPSWLAGRIDRWGYLEAREEYERALGEADIVVSTANHEFFGVSIAEAVAAGAYPLLPNRLAYPEILSPDKTDNVSDFFYDGTLENLVTALLSRMTSVDEGRLWGIDPRRAARAVEEYLWPNLGSVLDDALQEVTVR